MEVKKNEKMLVTMEEAAEITNIGKQTLKKMATENVDFPYIKVGVKYLVILAKLVDWFDKHKGEVFDVAG